MTMEEIYTDNAPQAVGPYVQARKVGNLLFCSGQIPIDPVTNKLVSGGIDVETTQVLENLKAVIEAGGSNMDSVVKVNIFLCDMKDFSIVNEIYADYFTNKPARACVEVSGLPKGVRVEMEAIALCE